MVHPPSGGSWEKEYPEGADMKPPKGSLVLLGGFCIANFPHNMRIIPSQCGCPGRRWTICLFQSEAGEVGNDRTCKEEKGFSLFLPRFFLLLGIAVMAFPFVERLSGFLSAALRYPEVAAALGSIVSFALIGGGFLKRRPFTQGEIVKASKPLPTGVFRLVTGIVLIAGYMGFMDFLSQRGRDTTSLEQIYLLLWYLACFLLLAKGFWQMAFRAYATQKKKSRLEETAKRLGLKEKKGIEMTPIERDLETIGWFIPGFFGLLGIIVAAFPFLDRDLGALPTALRHQDIASILASIAAYALIVTHYFTQRRAFRTGAAFSIGATSIAASVLLTVGYIGVADFLIRNNIRTSPLAEVGLIVWYVTIYCALTMGLWQMAWRAYRTRDKEIHFGWFE